jgi:hypothetical protein
MFSGFDGCFYKYRKSFEHYKLFVDKYLMKITGCIEDSRKT